MIKLNLFNFLFSIMLFCMKKSFYCLLICAFLVSCASFQKAKIANILHGSKIQFSGIALDSVEVSTELFEHIGTATKSLLPNPQVVVIVQDLARGIISSKLADAYISCDFLTELPVDSDSLFLRNVSAKISLDSLYSLPIYADSAKKLHPGKQNLKLWVKLPIDGRLFKIPELKKISVEGAISVSLKENSEPVQLPLNFEKVFSEEEKKVLFETAREKLLHSLVGDWVKSILP